MCILLSLFTLTLWPAKIDPILAGPNLRVNSSKTELTVIKQEKYRVDESWRKVKKLGSLMGDDEYIIKRKCLAAASLGKLQSL